MKSINIILLGFLSLFLQSCFNTNQKENTDNDFINNEFLGEWCSVERVIPFGAVLTIDTNYNFTYKGAVCMASFYSKGNWTLNNDTLTFNSIEPKECCYITGFRTTCAKVTIGDTTSYERFKPKTSIKDCEPDDIDYYYVIFKNEKFIIKDSTLIYLGKPDSICPEIKDDFIRKNRKS